MGQKEIQKHEEAERELSFQQDAYIEAQAIAHIGHWRLDLQEYHLFWSDEIYNILEIDREQSKPSQENFLKVIHPEDRDRVSETYNNSLNSKQSYKIIYRLKLPDSRIKHVQEHCKTNFDSQGYPLYSIGTVQDITKEYLRNEQLSIANKVAEEANKTLLENNTSLQLMGEIFSNSSESILVTDYQNKIIELNRAFERISGFSKEELLGKDPSVIASGRHEVDFFKEMWFSLEKDGYWSGEIWDRHKNGEIYPRDLAITKLGSEDPKLVKYVGIFTDISGKKASEKKLSQLAFFDPLTGLANRKLSRQELTSRLKTSQRRKISLGILFVDLDGFKAINDSMGHRMGDEVLVYVANQFKKIVRDSDLVCRHGGDEFLILLTDLSKAQDATYVAKNLIKVFESPIKLSNEKEVFLNCSIGISLSPDDSVDPNDLIRFADTAMYEAKKLGKGRFHYFSSEIEQRAIRRMVLDYKLHKALENKELVVHYQPQVNSLNGKVIGVESLIRWNDPKEGLISPAEFIPLAEEIGLIIEIGEFVLMESCRQNKFWQEMDICEIVISVNCSMRQFESGKLPDVVRQALHVSRLDPEFLKIEITEGLLMKNPEMVIKQLNKLREMGIGISMDDFGTGYSSLSILKTIPLTDLKIDRAFVTNISKDHLIAQVIADLSENMNLKTVAEGAELLEQVEVLHKLGCTTIQGFYYSKPLTAIEFEDFVKKGELPVVNIESD